MQVSKLKILKRDNVTEVTNMIVTIFLLRICIHMVALITLHLDLVQRHTPSWVPIGNDFFSWGPRQFQVPH